MPHAAVVRSAVAQASGPGFVEESVLLVQGSVGENGVRILATPVFQSQRMLSVLRFGPLLDLPGSAGVLLPGPGCGMVGVAGARAFWRPWLRVVGRANPSAASSL